MSVMKTFALDILRRAQHPTVADLPSLFNEPEFQKARAERDKVLESTFNKQQQKSQPR